MPEEKISKIIVRNDEGNLVQMLPKTVAQAVAYQDTDVAAELHRQDQQDIKHAEAKVESHSSSEQVVETIRTDLSDAMSNGKTHLSLGIKNVDPQTNEVSYSIINDIYGNTNITVTDATVNVLSDDTIYPNPETNTEYSLTFQIDGWTDGMELCGADFSLYWEKSGYRTATYEAVACGEGTQIGNYTVLDTTYQLWDGATATNEQYMKIDLSDNGYGEWTSNIRTKVEYNYSTYRYVTEYLTADSLPDNDIVKFSLQSLGNGQFKLIFSRSLFEENTEEKTVTTNWKTLDTTLTRNNDETVVRSVPISGLVQSVSAELETNFVANPQIEDDASYQVVFFINDNADS